MNFDTKDILIKYPKIKVKGYDKIINLPAGLFCINNLGRIIRIDEAEVWICRGKNKIWHELDIIKYVLIDDGMNVEDKIL